jgi:hypothetical protein
MALVGSPYPFSRSAGRCTATGEVFAEGAPYIATLVECEGRPGLERLDYSIAAWDGGQRPQAPLRLFGFWRGSYRAGDVKKQPLLGDAELLDLFEELGAATEPRQLTFRYLLTLLLVRRRVLRVVGTKPGTMMVVPRGEPEHEPMAVADPGLDDQAIADAIEQLGQVVATDSPQATEPKPPQGAPA